jgi:hypothetical protein
MVSCQARILNENKGPYWTTKECSVETSKRISIDEGEAYMSICSSCIRRFVRRNLDPSWYGWFDCDYPPEARVVGSKWYYENVPASQRPVVSRTEVPTVNLFDPEPEYVPTPVTVQGPSVTVQASEPEAQEPTKDAVMEELQTSFAQMTVADKKNELRQRIKEIQKVAKPGKMTLKEIQAAFKEITNLKTQIHML